MDSKSHQWNGHRGFRIYRSDSFKIGNVTVFKTLGLAVDLPLPLTNRPVYSPGLLPKYRCLVPECELPSNASYSYQGLTADFGQPDFVQATILSLGLGDHTCMRKVLKQEDPHTSCAKFVSIIEHNPQNVKGMILSNKEGYF